MFRFNAQDHGDIIGANASYPLSETVIHMLGQGPTLCITYEPPEKTIPGIESIVINSTYQLEKLE